MTEVALPTIDRFAFQRECALASSGIVLNVGCNEDPALIRRKLGSRCINCDIEAYDSYMSRPNVVDRVFDMREEWPFEDDLAELVIIGDTLEHLYPGEALDALTQARRVGWSLCLTVPQDSRWRQDGVRMADSGYRTHCTEVTEEYLRKLLHDTLWEPKVWHTVDYGFVPRGFLVLSRRKEVA